MRSFIRVAAVLSVALLSACITADSELDRATMEAEERCAEQGMQLVSTESEQTGVPNVTRLTTIVQGFCVDETDPRWVPPENSN